MSTTIALPEGYRAILRDPKELRERHRRLIQTAIVPLQSVFLKIPRDLIDKAAGGDKDAAIVAEGYMITGATTRLEAIAMMEFRDAIIIALLEHWTRPEPLPTIDNVTDLEPALYAALADGIRDHTGGLMEAAMGTDFNTTPGDKPSPFGPSGSSARSSRRKASGAKSATKRRTAGVSTSTGTSSVA